MSIIIFNYNFANIFINPSANSILPKNMPAPNVTALGERFFNANGKAATDAKL